MRPPRVNIRRIPISSERVIVICAPDQSSVRAAIRTLGSSRFAWAYFGASFHRAESLAQRLGPEPQNIDCAPGIRAAADELRQQYLDYVGELSRANTSTWWRRSCVAEKNPYVSNVFLHVCCVRAVERLLGTIEKERPLLVVVESRPLRMALARHLGAALCEPRWIGAALWARGAAEILVRQMLFIVSSLRKIGYARYVYRMHRTRAVLDVIARGQPICVANVWVDQRAYDPETGEFSDVDFAEVLGYLKSIGKRSFTVPNVLQSASYQRVVRYIARSKQDCLVPHAYLTLSDVVRAAVISLSARPGSVECPKFEGIDVSTLIAHDLRRDWCRQREAPNILLGRLVKRWKAKGLRVERFIYTFENHIWERVLCEEFRRSYPDVKLIGYQPNGLPLFLMNYFISAMERDTIALPDCVVTNGRYAAQLLKQSGYDPERIVCGGGLRQRYLQPWLCGDNGYAPRPSRTDRRVLVTTSIGPDKTVELVWKCVTALANVPGVRVTVKCHPSMPLSLVENLAGVWRSSQVDITTATLRELLPEADVVVYTGDSGFPCVEALAAGVPVVYVEPGYGLPLDSLDGFRELRMTARTPAEIRVAVCQLLNVSEKDLTQARHRWREAARQLIGPVDTATLELFAQ